MAVKQDRVEPDPKGYVLGVFALGALLAAGVGQPLIDQVFRVSQWLYADTVTTLLGSWLRGTGRPAAALLEGGYHDDLPLLIEAFLKAWDNSG